VVLSYDINIQAEIVVNTYTYTCGFILWQ